MGHGMGTSWRSTPSGRMRSRRHPRHLMRRTRRYTRLWFATSMGQLGQDDGQAAHQDERLEPTTTVDREVLSPGVQRALTQIFPAAAPVAADEAGTVAEQALRRVAEERSLYVTDDSKDGQP